MYEVKVLQTLDDVSLYENDWDQLLSESAGHNIFHTRQMLKSLLHNNAENLLAVIIFKDDTAVSLSVFLKKNERFKLKFGVFTVMRLWVSRLRLLGDDVVIMQGEDGALLYKLTLDALNSCVDKIDYIVLDNLKVNSSIWNFFKSNKFLAHGFMLKRTSPVLQELRGISLGENHEHYLKGLTGKTRYNLRSRVKKLWKEGCDEVDVLRIDDSGQMRSFLNHVDHVFNNSWRAKLIGAKQRSIESTAEQLRLVSDYGWFRSYVLLVKGQAIAYALGYQYNDTYLLEEIAYDKDWAAFGAGSVLNFKLIEDLFDYKKPDFIDFGYGENEYKRILGNSLEYSCMAYLIPRGNIKGRLIIGVQRLLYFAYLWSDLVIDKIGISDWLKKTIKRNA